MMRGLIVMELIYKKADITAIELLITTRIEVLRAANNLSNEIDMTDKLRISPMSITKEH